MFCEARQGKDFVRCVSVSFLFSTSSEGNVLHLFTAFHEAAKRENEQTLPEDELRGKAVASSVSVRDICIVMRVVLMDQKDSRRELRLRPCLV